MTCSKFLQSLRGVIFCLGSTQGAGLSREPLRERQALAQCGSLPRALPLRTGLLLELQLWTKVLVEMMLEGFVLSSQLMECSIPAYKSLIVTLQMSSASKDWPLTQPLVPSSDTLLFLEAVARSAGQGHSGSDSLGEGVGFTGSPGLSAETLPQHPGGEAKPRCQCSKPPCTQGASSMVDQDHIFKII